MDLTLQQLVLDRLDAEARAEAEAAGHKRGRRPALRTADWDYLVLASLDGEQAVEDVLARDAPAPRPVAEAKPKGETAGAPPAEPPGAYLRSVTVEGFRGIGPRARLELTPGPGLTLVVGRNGSGKSSFAEALELLLTGTSMRWEGRSRLWKDGWRSLHHSPTAIEAELLLDGRSGSATAARSWSDSFAIDQAPPATLQPHGRPRGRLTDLGWEAPLSTFRPFLSYSELGALLDGRNADLHDALVAILGIDDLRLASDALREARALREGAWKEADRQRQGLLADLGGLDDDRARAAIEALELEGWDLETLEALVSGAAEAAPDGVLRLLQRLTALPCPSRESTEAVKKALEEADEAVRRTAGTLAGRSRDLADILDRALRFHETNGDGPCPVCGREGALDGAWHEHQAQEARRLREAAVEATKARQAADAARKTARALPAPDAALLAKAGEAGLDAAEAEAARAAFAETVQEDDLGKLAERLGPAADRLRQAVEDLRARAQAELQHREDRWRPLARRIAAWVPTARLALRGAAAVPRLKQAEKWLKEATDAIRNDRFSPIKERAQAIWSRLRLQSNVDLRDVRLTGSKTSRQVELSVAVDGKDGTALGVMSQGELHALALSLFIPRATLPESPFRFIVIDDPVQSMDPSRVDGLARVLSEVAKTRQVVVFTHDDRLPESFRRLGLDATVVEVTRRENSVVETRLARDPVSRYLDDALAVALTEDLPLPAARRVVPGLCRLAIEAACTEAVRRRRLNRGEPHADVERLLESCHGSKALMSLALFDDPGRTGEVMPRLNREHRLHADVFRLVNEGAHELQAASMRDTVHDARRLAEWVQRLQ